MGIKEKITNNLGAIMYTLGTMIVFITLLSSLKIASLYDEITTINTVCGDVTSSLNKDINLGDKLLLRAKKQITLLNKRLKRDLGLGKFVLELMNEVKSELSPMRKQLVAQTVVRVTNNIFDKMEYKYHFAVLLAMESKFDNNAKSPAGAVGIAQIMPKFAKGFAKVCGIDDYTFKDLRDLELNMTIGACQFNALLLNKNINGNVASALVAYNAGINSISFRSLVGLKNIKHIEPANYVARFTFLSSEIKNLVKKSEKAVEERQKE